jgi:GNAT superfamily N-acetyltransferase
MTEQKRKTPEKIRVTKLQEAQLAALARIEQACAAQFYEAGYTPEQVAPRPELEIARLPKSHDVLVAEADNVPAAYLAWADQAPGVGWVPILVVAPEFQRFGVGTHLLRELGEVAGRAGIRTVVTPCWERAKWALSFLRARSFQMLEGTATIIPETLAGWRVNRSDEEDVAGQRLWWASTDGLGTIPGIPRPPPSTRM